MLKANLKLDRDFRIGQIDKRLYGSFIEHLGRAVYTGIYEPEHECSNSDGFREDVAELVKELNVPIIRYPGGNFVSGYNWEDGIGPKNLRPSRLELAWKATETNEVGTDEFVKWCRLVNSEPMLAVNLGTRGADAARNLVEYCNHPSGSYWSDLRIANGSPEPHRIKTWCLGNEMDGEWQMGHKTAPEYARIAEETGKLMKLTDPDIELVVCGSSGGFMSTMLEWEATVLDRTYDLADYVSVHGYLSKGKDLPEFLAKSIGMDNFISAVVSTCDYIQAKKRSKKKMMLSFDEWNVWYHSHSDPPIQPWQTAPALLEDVYTLEDALVVGLMLNTLIRHADRIKIACQAQLVNVIAPIMTAAGGPAWRQSIFYPFLHASKYARGVSLQPVVKSDGYETSEYGFVPFVDISSSLDEESGNICVLAVNRSLNEDIALTCDLRGLGAKKALEHITLTHTDPLAVNTAENPNNVIPANRTVSAAASETLEVVLPALSWNIIRLA